jgi:hypothetical protein
MSIKLIIWLIGIIIYFIYKIITSNKKKELAQEVIVDKPYIKPTVNKRTDITNENKITKTAEKSFKPKTITQPVSTQSTVLEQNYKHSIVDNNDLKPAQLEHFEIKKAKPHSLKIFLKNKSNLKKAFITAEIFSKKA